MTRVWNLLVSTEGDKIIEWERVRLPQTVLTQGDVCMDTCRSLSLTVPALNPWGMDLTWGEHQGFWILRTQKCKPKLKKKMGNLEFPRMKTTLVSKRHSEDEEEANPGQERILLMRDRLMEAHSQILFKSWAEDKQITVEKGPQM